MCSGLEIAKPAILLVQFPLRACPVSPGVGRRQNLNLSRGFDFRYPSQAVTYDLSLGPKLGGITQLLKIPPAAPAKVWARRLLPVRRTLQNLFYRSPDDTPSLPFNAYR